MLDLIIKNGECYIDGKITKTNIGIQNGKISIIGDLNNEQSKETVDASNLNCLHQQFLYFVRCLNHQLLRFFHSEFQY